MKKNLLALMMLLLAASTFAQVSITGIIKDASNGEPLIGATIFIEETSEGTFTLLNGEFDMPLEKNGEYNLRFSYIGYITLNKKVTVNGDLDMGTIELDANAVGLNEVKIVADVAIDRKTPVAVSTISIRQIEEKLGNQEFPEILKTTPSTYATKQGGGFGDSRINIRGFDARNTATLINGVPVNDMENGWVYWSNWAGLADVTRSIQLQRGLGASKLALPSLGGTINILTKTTDAEKGGNLTITTANDNFLKYGATFSTGLSENGWASSISLAKTTGNGYVDGTEFESYSYYVNISKRLTENQHLSFSIFGAPQWHGQRRTKLTIEEYENNKNGIKYNQDWGYKEGEVFYLNKNFYHKPQAILNHFWSIDETSSLMTAVYGSIGTGGGTGGLGETGKFFGDYLYDGQIDWDRIVDENIALGTQGSETILRSSMNNHAWYGIVSNYKKEINDELTVSGGVDGRYYKGEHYREVTDLLGGKFYVDNSDVNNRNNFATTKDKVAYNNDGLVSWGGAYLTGEYETGNLTAFLSGSFSLKGYKRIDYFNYFNDNLIDQINASPSLEAQYRADLGDDKFEMAMLGQETDWQSFFGYVFKGGANYNITETMNAYLNIGYFERQPDFDAVFLNNRNNVNEDAENEKVFSVELGYGFQNKYLKAQANVYNTLWKDKTFSKGFLNENTNQYYNVNILGVDALHQGIEMELTAQPNSKLRVDAMASLNNWKWKNNIENVDVYDDEQNYDQTIDVYVKDVHVGDAAQTTFFLGATYELIPSLKLGVDFYHFGNVYASFDPLSRLTKNADGSISDSWKMPDYQLVDARIVYDFDFSNLKASFFAKVNNVFDTEYISDAEDGNDHGWETARVFYGFGRTWSVGLKINF
jgi:iron complex outermembrane receptor protein